jgi:hypothetical protein
MFHLSLARSFLLRSVASAPKMEISWPLRTTNEMHHDASEAGCMALCSLFSLFMNEVVTNPCLFIYLFFFLIALGDFSQINFWMDHPTKGEFGSRGCRHPRRDRVH